MPFTISHPAAVLPLKHLAPRYLSLTGLMAGAVSPDLLYFLTLSTTHRGFSHSWTGLFIFCLPAGIVFSYVFHRLFKYHAILKLPRPLDRIFSGLAVSRFRIDGTREWIVLIFSILVGALSHFAWDSFTNPTGEMTKIIPYLLEESPIPGFPLENYIILHFLSTLLGGAFVLIFVFRSRYMPRPVIEKSIFSTAAKFRFWLIGLALATGFAFGIVAIFGYYHGWENSGQELILDAFKTFGLAGWAGFFYYSCV